MNKRVLVTGAASGIGRGIAEKFLSAGCKVVLLDKDEQKLSAALQDLAELKGASHAVICDISDENEVQSAADACWKCWDGLDILINNAGWAAREPFLEISLANWDKILEINLRGTFLLSQWISKEMAAQQIPGSIVNISSKNGLAGSSKLAHYNASKAGINLLTQSMAVELAAYNIRVNAVAPGFIDTPLDQALKQKEEQLNLTDKTPLNRLGTIEEVANGVFFLASDQASYITGSILPIDGGHLANASEF
ncbi:SDR family NAD(P)-dependent oxidoreductase [Virgibacillus salexigens]|uniref:3-oxoacyl-[acyl-carrier-protein] reductase FabG n=2 Tax=Virgibacillus TaxID=84406 RepID=A0A024Q9Q4_9BACI|nr:MULTISPECIES: SDR family NAD(P)-dependent oxidoreductase [Virgibacillus]GGJ58156.1 3-oxoacyl-[acyl-carrier-protein] reductase FabG [Virgibacillus kapii]CDQ38681.1 3-oxoacyl-[acyl-carrier-protein] reductase FabG [Virgibacillus massiliensis]